MVRLINWLKCFLGVHCFATYEEGNGIGRTIGGECTRCGYLIIWGG